MSKTALVVGSGKKFGSEISKALTDSGYTVYCITSNVNSESSRSLLVDWQTCTIATIEGIVKKLPNLDIVVFNQNFPVLTDSYLTLGTLNPMDVWAMSQRWTQAHYVNCILPLHLLNSLSKRSKLSSESKIAWMLSRSMFQTESGCDYIGQKYQNYISMTKLAKSNPETYLGFCPGGITTDSSEYKATEFVKFLINSNQSQTGKFFVLKNQTVEEHE